MSIRKDSQQVLTHPRIWKAQYIYGKLQKLIQWSHLLVTLQTVD